MQANGTAPCEVFVVDSSQEAIGSLQTMLEARGDIVYWFSCPEDALEYVSTVVPDAVLTSLLFSWMNGFEFCVQLRKIPQTSRARIVALTNVTFPGIEEITQEAGFDQYLISPVTAIAINDVFGNDRKRIA